MRKAAHQPNSYTVDVSIDAQPTHELCALLVCELVKYLQYSRGQVQTPCDQLLAQVQAWTQAREQALTAGSKKKRRPPAGMRKALKYSQCLQALLSAAQQVPYEQLDGGPVVIVFGATPRRPAEVYRVFLPPCIVATTHVDMQEPGSVGPSSTASSSRSIAAGDVRRVLRALVMQHATITEWDAQPGATKMFVLFQAPSGSQLPPSFLPKRNFTVALRRKAFQVDICMNMKVSPSAAPIHPLQRLDMESPVSPTGLQQQMQDSMHISHGHDADAGLTWHQTHVVLKGIRPSNSSS